MVLCVLQCIAVRRSVLQCVAVCCNELENVCDDSLSTQGVVAVCVAVCCSVLQCVAMCCSELENMSDDSLSTQDFCGRFPSINVRIESGLLHCLELHGVAWCCSVLQYVVMFAVCCSIHVRMESAEALQHAATHYNTLQRTATNCNTVRCESDQQRHRAFWC